MSRGPGVAQRFILEHLSTRERPATVALLAHAWANRDRPLPGTPGRREATAAEYESIRRACRNLAGAGRIRYAVINYKGGETGWGYVLPAGTVDPLKCFRLKHLPTPGP